MIKKFIFFSLGFVSLLVCFSFDRVEPINTYKINYFNKLDTFESKQIQLIELIEKTNLKDSQQVELIKTKLLDVRNNLKGLDFWLRYIEPLSYKKINGPLPVEWETEVFEKFEKPYKRECAGYTLAFQYLEEDDLSKDHLINLLSQSLAATKTYYADSISNQLNTYHHFYLCNRLFILNLAAIYTTGFDCPVKENIIPELLTMLNQVGETYQSFNQSFPTQKLPNNYVKLYNQAIKFVAEQHTNYNEFDHYTFIKKFVNPLFGLNQELIINYKVQSRSVVDYSLNKQAQSIFSKQLYTGQSSKGVFLRVNDEQALKEINDIGKLLFYDPILSANNERSCASCHNPQQFFTDTNITSAPQFDKSKNLLRNTPSLINVPYQHLIMADGKHFTLQEQAKSVITNSLEMSANEKEVLQKVLQCKDYNQAFANLLKYTPTEKSITMEHVVSAITVYYSTFSNYSSPFDGAMNNQNELTENEKKGFNIFMGKGNCATCHFVPQFNGVKPPYIGSEFEVIGVPEDLIYTQVSDDAGRYLVHTANETLNAFRTSTVRNATHTKPYMHNGVFKSLEEVIAFYNKGGGVGFGLQVNNQTLSSDSLNLSSAEKICLLDFLESLSEKIAFQQAPEGLPKSSNKALNNRKVGGVY